ncbi:hypothetical protein GPECTOR_6g888 [Gonium pectorale]|uniref:Uncharacterized protein n=1 Tax=Gonium pectorale TaxID=33097 RepID=A0A150GVV4_GONPE|nr:hypothetical protein GPECTOR_6g888 [Gonium pectorale]|eukprot:KXZ53969.1 hypothetical protein GPECTOR_6g888 [Gonium pectorale]
MASFVDDLLREATGALGGATPAHLAPGAEAVAAEPQRIDGTAEASISAARPRTSASVAGSVAGADRSGTGRRRVRITGTAGSGAGGSKPAWALSSEEAAQLEDEEEAELLRFADELDFDSFMAALDDAELQETVNKAIQGEDGKGPAPGEERAWKRQLVAAMNHAAMKRVAAARNEKGPGDTADNDGASVAAGSEGGATALSRAAAASRVRAEQSARGDRGWDGSTRGAEDLARLERARAATAEAADFLRENPELRAVHSPASVRALIGKKEVAGVAAS